MTLAHDRRRFLPAAIGCIVIIWTAGGCGQEVVGTGSGRAASTIGTVGYGYTAPNEDPITPSVPPTFTQRADDVGICRIERGVSTIPDVGSPASPAEALRQLDAAPATPETPFPGARRMVEGKDMIHGYATLDGLGYDHYVEVSAGYGSQAGAYDYTYLGRVERNATRFTPDVVLRGCPAGTLMGRVGNDDHLWSFGQYEFADFNITRSAKVSRSTCDQCRARAAKGRCDCTAMIDAGDELLAVLRWGVKLAAVTFDKATDRQSS